MKANRAILLISLTLAGVAVVGLASKILRGGPPFRMAFRAVAGGTVVRFVQPGRALVSPDFPVSIPIPTPPRGRSRRFRPDDPGLPA